MEKKFCRLAERRVAPNECGTFEACPNLSECRIRQHYEKYYGWLTGEKKGNPQKADPEPNPSTPEPAPGQDSPELKKTTRQCNMCYRPLDIINFRDRKDGKGKKKTCADCEDKYVTKSKPLTGGQGKAAKAEKKKPAAAHKKTEHTEPKKSKVSSKSEPSPAPEQKPALDLSGFTWLENQYRTHGEPAVRIGEKDVIFNASARKQFQSIFETCQTIDIGVRQNGNGTELAFRPHPNMLGQYRVQFGTNGKSEARICISLSTKGVKIGKGPWPVREVDGVFLAEVDHG